MIISETKDLQKILLRIQHEQIKMSTDIFKLTNNGTSAGNNTNRSVLPLAKQVGQICNVFLHNTKTTNQRKLVLNL